MTRLMVTIFVLLAVSAAIGQSQPAQPEQDDYSGMYTFLKGGEFVQINQEGEGKVSGFISRYGDRKSDRGVLLSHFFRQGTLTGNQIQFTTETVHGEWFEFKGVVGRGSGKTPDDEDYYQMKGKLTEHSTNSEEKASARSREVTFKSLPQEVGGGRR